MSFVSIVATTKFINVCTDGRGVNKNGDPVQEDIEKYFRIDEKTFIAFAGDTQPCLVGAGNMIDIIRNNKNIPLSDFVPHFKEKVSEEFQGMKAQFAIGGINEENEVGFFAFGVTQELLCLKPQNKDDVKYGFLYSSEIEDKIGFGELKNQLLIGIKKTEKGFKSASDIILAQQILNDYVAEYDRSVNNRTFTLTLRRRE